MTSGENKVSQRCECVEIYRNASFAINLQLQFAQSTRTLLCCLLMVSFSKFIVKIFHSLAFPGTDVGSVHETVSLSETSETLELLLQFMYNRPQPDLGKVKFHALDNVAEAAEKYQVYHAMPICKLQMQ